MNGLRVVGLDLSLASPGAARIERSADGVWSTGTWSWPNKGKRADTLYARHRRIADLAAQIVPVWAERIVDLVVIEGPAPATRGASTWDRAGLWWRVMGTLIDGSIPVVQVAPTMRAKWASGSGRGDKAAVGAAIARMWPAAELSDSDRADALALASIGVQLLCSPSELPFTVPAYRVASVSALKIQRGGGAAA